MSDFTPQLGWARFEDRTAEQKNAHDAAVKSMPRFFLSTPPEGDAPKKVVLTDFWKHPLVVQALGYAFPRIHQTTGSCVGAGGGNALFSLMAIEVAKLGDLEQICVPGWLYTYGKSRQRGGFRGRGEGSMGSSWAEAIKLDGILPANFRGLPAFENSDGLTWSRDDEFRWSDGAAAPADVVAEAKRHPVKTVAPLRTVDEIITAIRNLYPVTWACSRYIGRPSVRNGMLVGTLDSGGGHQTSLQGVWDTGNGVFVKNQNNWPASAYPKDPDPEASSVCACWQPVEDLERYLRNGDAECYALSAFDGFPAQKFSWLV